MEKLIKSQTNKNYFSQWYEGRPTFKADKSQAKTMWDKKELMKWMKKLKSYFTSKGTENILKAINK